MFLLLNLLVIVVLFGAISPTVIFGLAGRWDLWNVWAYAGISVISLAFQTLVIYRQSSDLLKARMIESGGRVRWTAHHAFVVLSILQWSIAGLDQRFHWSDNIPSAGLVAGLVIVAIGWGLTTWSVWVNRFFSPTVRIQADRGQRVISTGPYAIVRHPGYATILLYMVASAVALNSLLSIIPAVIYMAVTVRQTMIEDRMLRDELAGYADYAAKVRFRLIPGIW
jgi:protein-S-isoprenylcysteine O-methyltransferase Ste14